MDIPQVQVEKVQYGTDLNAFHYVAASPAHHERTQPPVHWFGLLGKAHHRDHSDHQQGHANEKPALPAANVGQK